MVSDCLLAMQTIQDSELDLSVVSHVFIDIKELSDHLPQVTLSYEPRQTHQVAHTLVSYSFELLVNHSWFVTNPDFVQDPSL